MGLQAAQRHTPSGCSAVRASYVTLTLTPTRTRTRTRIRTRTQTLTLTLTPTLTLTLTLTWRASSLFCRMISAFCSGDTLAVSWLG